MLPGDLICCTNNNHGLFGIGVVCSQRKYEGGIHDTESVDTKEFYDHYVDVAWLKNEYTKKEAIKNPQNETWWEPYGTLKEKSPIPYYILNIVFKIPAEIKTEQSKEKIMANLNTILYGPPGTGKTYNTISKAILIANPAFSLTDSDGKDIPRTGVKAEYERLVKSWIDCICKFSSKYKL